METATSEGIACSKALVQRILTSTYINKSARLTEMFRYLCKRVLDESIDEIHELEVGCNVFGRPANYDTVADNIVRVHASMLRKRLNEYFTNEGRDEPLIVDIPRGNYAPVFRKRKPELLAPDASLQDLVSTNLTALSGLEFAAVDGIAGQLHVSVHEIPPARQDKRTRLDWTRWLPIALAVFFACLSGYLLIRDRTAGHAASTPEVIARNSTTVRQFWSQIFHATDSAEIVLDDASADFYQEASTHSIALAEYFDRSYLRSVEDNTITAKLDPRLVESFMLRRQTSYSNTALIWKLAQTADVLQSNANLHFARDFSFRMVKSGNVILLGNRQSNPWIQPFESHLGIRWKFDTALAAYYPVDTMMPVAEQGRFRPAADAGKTHEGYASISFLPNLSGNVLIISGSGGAATSAALDFLLNEQAMKDLHSRLASTQPSSFPYFEVLLRVDKGTTLPRTAAIVIVRTPAPVRTDAPAGAVKQVVSNESAH